MSFTLETLVKADAGLVNVSSGDRPTDIQALAAEGCIIPVKNSKRLMELDAAEPDPLLRLVSGWLIKLPWVMSGDEECVPLKHSPFCYGFEPDGPQVRIYFYEGTEGEVENLVMEPVAVPLADFITASLSMGELMLAWATADSAQEDEEDLIELRQVLKEAKAAWARRKREP